LDPVLRLAEDRAQSPRFTAQSLKDLRVLGLERRTFGVQEALPGVLLRDDLLRLELPGRALVRHLQEQQVRKLLGVLDDADAIVTQDVGVGPKLVNQMASVAHASSS